MKYLQDMVCDVVLDCSRQTEIIEPLVRASLKQRLWNVVQRGLYATYVQPAEVPSGE